MARIIKAEYFKESFEITEAVATTEGIKITFQRNDGSTYIRPYSVSSTTNDPKEMLIRGVERFKYEILEIYRIFVSDKIPEIQAHTMKEFANKFIPLLLWKNNLFHLKQLN